MTDVRLYVADLIAGRPRQYLGHNPAGRIAVTLLLCLLLVQTITGLILAGTDLFYPHVGSLIAQWVAAPGIDPATLVPYSPETYNKAAYDSMRVLREPVVAVHYYGFYVPLAFSLIQVVAVALTELREGGNLDSAMVTGKKVLSEAAADQIDSD